MTDKKVYEDGKLWAHEQLKQFFLLLLKTTIEEKGDVMQRRGAVLQILKRQMCAEFVNKNKTCVCGKTKANVHELWSRFQSAPL